MAIEEFGDTATYEAGGKKYSASGVFIIGGTTGGVKDSTGAVIYPDSLPMTGATYDVDGNPLTMTKSDGTDSWVMTFTWDANGNLLTQSVWERQ